MISRKLIALSLISIALLVFTFLWFDIDDLFGNLRLLETEYLVFAFAFLIVSYLVAYFRFKFLLDHFSPGVPLSASFSSYAVGHVGNLLLFNVVGQSVSRAMILARNGVSSEAVVGLTYYERILSAAVLTLGAILALGLTFPGLKLDINLAGYQFLFTIISSGVVALGTFLILFKFREILAYNRAAFQFVQDNLAAILLTMLIQGCMLMAYLVILMGQESIQINIGIIAALLIVMFVASLPISFSGWGVREVSAASALSVVGIDPSVSVTMAIVIGILSQTMVYLIAIVTALQIKGLKNQSDESNQPATSGKSISHSSFIQAVVILMSILIYFQVWVPVNNNNLSVNLADVLAFTCLGLVFLQMLNPVKKLNIAFELRLLLAGVTMVLVVAFIIGYFRFGLTGWAFTNRGVGWLILLGYIGAGLLCVNSVPGSKRLLLKSLVVTAVLVSVIQIIAHSLKIFYPLELYLLLGEYYSGFSANTNAYAFQLLMATIALIVLGRDGVKAGKTGMFCLVISLIAINMGSTMSRAGIITLLFLCLLALRTIPVSRIKVERKSAYLVLFLMMGIYLLPVVKPYIIDFYPDVSGDFFEVSKSKEIDRQATYTFQRTRGDAVRWVSIANGWELFRENPVFGAGLGANIHRQLEQSKPALVIHSIPVWFLAEFGLVGTLLIVGCFTVLIYRCLLYLKNPDTRVYSFGVIGIVGCLFIAGMVHDFFYQRIFWFLLGIFMAVEPGRKSWAESHTGVAGIENSKN